MINIALKLVSQRLNSHLQNRLGETGELVHLSPLVDAQGQRVAEMRHRLTMFMVSVAQNAMPTSSRQGRATRMSQGTRDPLHLDVYFMLAAGCGPENYADGLKLISEGITFFQSYPVMTQHDEPGMLEGLEQLTFELNNLTVTEQEAIWNIHGGRYVPSALFKMRGVTLDGGRVMRVDPLIGEPVSTDRS